MSKGSVDIHGGGLMPMGGVEYMGLLRGRGMAYGGILLSQHRYVFASHDI